MILAEFLSEDVSGTGKYKLPYMETTAHGSSCKWRLVYIKAVYECFSTRKLLFMKAVFFNMEAAVYEGCL